MYSSRSVTMSDKLDAVGLSIKAVTSLLVKLDTFTNVYKLNRNLPSKAASIDFSTRK